ncbi:MAG: type II CRISPR RNA-guided endonuclease Cas9 [Planctomycetes bacterium B3_Pla]|nr:MAG: type II CRISPR RNA-guided endonuclease Cas9 [Planctomycetes bacterium B3_Pla]
MHLTTLGLDIGSNSVGSAWIDLKNKRIKLGGSVFPAGVEDSDTKRGAPKNQARRGYRSQARITKRRAERKHQMRRFLLERGWMPSEKEQEAKWLEKSDPWILRKEGLERELTEHEFGRVLLHMSQRRGAYGFDIDEENEDAGKVKDAINQTQKTMEQYKVRTFGELMAIKLKERRTEVGRKHKKIAAPIRNRTKASGEGTYEFCADRSMIWEEFHKLWEMQKSFTGELAKQLTDEDRKALDDSEGDATWRCKGILFGQRKTYWDVGTMARCDLEPTDMKCPKADMYAQDFLVLETVNNIRITPRGELKRPLEEEERKEVIAVLEKQKTASEGTVRKALGIDRGVKKTMYTLSLEKDPKRGLNTNWFKREIVTAIGREEWAKFDAKKQQSINKAILKFDPQLKKDQQRLREGCFRWWEFKDEQTEKFIEAWRERPKVDTRINYSRKAIINLLPYMREGFTVNEARNRFAEDAENGASDAQRQRYSFGARAGNRRVRHYMQKHPELLPPAPENISNPVVRRAIHEVRRHIQAYIHEFGCKPKRVVVELAREARQSEYVRNRQLSENRKREEKRKEIIEKFDLAGETKTQQAKAVKRVLLSREQKYWCAYCDNNRDTISEELAASGEGVELDHIVPESRGGNSYLSNLVLCHSECNRGKGNRTPKEWLTVEEFVRLEQRLKHLERDNKVKWDNLHEEVPDLDGFVESQLTDTAYAARQVVAWLERTLYGDKNDGKRRVFTTKGRYTAILRRDWGLLPDKTGGGDKEGKNRADHRHHAIDAVIIALSGPERLSQLAKAAEAVEKEEVARREPIVVPWGNFDSFRADVMKEWKKLVVSHRPERRKIAGSLHKDTQFGPVVDKNGRLTGEFTIRKFAMSLKPSHLRVPKGWEELRAKLDRCTTKRQRRKIRARMLALPDVSGGKSGLIRDRWFREELRNALRREGLNPDSFTDTQMKMLVKNKGLILDSGVPIRRVTLVRRPTIVEIKRKRWNPSTGKMEYVENVRSRRYYEPQNNHHVEIRENNKGRWIGQPVTNFDASKRVRPSKISGNKTQSAVNRGDTKDGKFIMSLSIGEMVYMKHPETGIADYFVVFKIDGNGYIHFTPHTDAGRAKETDKFPAREDIRLLAAQLQTLDAQEGKGPQKVWIGPLGDQKILARD